MEIIKLITILVVLKSSISILDNYSKIYETLPGLPEYVSEEDLSLVVDALHLASHLPGEDIKKFINDADSTLNSAKKETSSIRTVIDSTTVVIDEIEKGMKGLFDTGNLVNKGTEVAKNLFNGLLSRKLPLDVFTNIDSMIKTVKSKTTEVSGNCNEVDKNLTDSLNILSIIKDLSSGNVSGIFNKVLNMFRKLRDIYAQNAHLEAKLRGRRRLSIYQQNQRKSRLLRLSRKLDKLIHAMETVKPCKLATRQLNSHFYDLIQEEGVTGSVYSRLVDTLEQILSKQDCNSPYIKLINNPEPQITNNPPIIFSPPKADTANVSIIPKTDNNSPNNDFNDVNRFDDTINGPVVSKVENNDTNKEYIDYKPDNIIGEIKQNDKNQNIYEIIKTTNTNTFENDSNSNYPVFVINEGNTEVLPNITNIPYETDTDIKRMEEKNNVNNKTYTTITTNYIDVKKIS